MSDSPLILSLETATLAGSVWVGRGPTELSAATGDPRVSQSNSLIGDIARCLKEAGVSLGEVDLFACASGPGSFTGLRIGIATLKGLAATLNRPCLGIPTLEAIAHAAGESKATVAILPAGRGEVFAQMFSVSMDEGRVVVNTIDTAAHLSPPKLIEKYAAHAELVWAGPGAHLQRAIIEEEALARGIPLNEELIDEPTKPLGWRLARIEENLAKHVAAMAVRAFNAGSILRAETLSAIYVRPSDAELKVHHK